MVKECLITAQKIIKNYGENQVLKEIDLCVSAYERVCILGVSGSGKTTLLNILAGLLSPSSGQVIIQQESLSGPNSETVRVNNIGMIFQQFELLEHMNALENVMSGLIFAGHNEEESRIIASDKLKEVELGPHMFKLPSQLSSGQKQRVGIARALGRHPSIIIADEPCGSLDSKTSNLIMELLMLIVEKNKSLIYSTHNLEIASYATKIYILKNGGLELASIDELRHTSKIKELYL